MDPASFLRILTNSTLMGKYGLKSFHAIDQK